jgi:hypothetical protein
MPSMRYPLTTRTGAYVYRYYPEWPVGSVDGSRRRRWGGHLRSRAAVGLVVIGGRRRTTEGSINHRGHDRVEVASWTMKVVVKCMNKSIVAGLLGFSVRVSSWKLDV